MRYSAWEYMSRWEVELGNNIFCSRAKPLVWAFLCEKKDVPCPGNEMIKVFLTNKRENSNLLNLPAHPNMVNFDIKKKQEWPLNHNFLTRGNIFKIFNKSVRPKHVTQITIQPNTWYAQKQHKQATVATNYFRLISTEKYQFVPFITRFSHTILRVRVFVKAAGPRDFPPHSLIFIHFI